LSEHTRTTKLVLIGAGSAVFTKGLVADMIQTPDLGPWELGLVDIDPAALETAEGLCRRMVDATGAQIAVRASENRRDRRRRDDNRCGRAAGLGG